MASCPYRGVNLVQAVDFSTAGVARGRFELWLELVRGIREGSIERPRYKPLVNKLNAKKIRGHVRVLLLKCQSGELMEFSPAELLQIYEVFIFFHSHTASGQQGSPPQK